LTKSSIKTLVHSKETIVYQVTMQNTGDPAKDLWVNDTLPAGLTYLSDTANDLGSAFRARVVSGNSLYLRLGDMPSLQTWSFTVLGSEAARDLWVNLTLGPGLGYLNATLVPLLNGGEVHFTLSNVPLGPTTIFLNASVDPGVADHWPMTINGSVTYTDAYGN